MLNHIFTSPGHDGTPQKEHRSHSPPDIRIGDYIDSDGRDRQRVISVRNGGTRGLWTGNTVLFVTTVRASDSSFASERRVSQGDTTVSPLYSYYSVYSLLPEDLCPTTENAGRFATVLPSAMGFLLLSVL